MSAITDFVNEIKLLLKKEKRAIIIGAVIIILATAASIFSVGYFITARKLNNLIAASVAPSKQEIASLVAKVNKLIVLPSNEEPTVATINNVEDLAKEQPFYKNAHNGDRLLVYVKEQKAIIYDPNRNVLVNVGPVFVNDSATTTPAGEKK